MTLHIISTRLCTSHMWTAHPLRCAGAIPALSLLLQSPSCMARQAAARAVSNLVVHNGGWSGAGWGGVGLVWAAGPVLGLVCRAVLGRCPSCRGLTNVPSTPLSPSLDIIERKNGTLFSPTKFAEANKIEAARFGAIHSLARMLDQREVRV